MKKGLILLSTLLVLSTAAFAQVTAVKDGDVAKVTWTYTPDYDAAFVGLVGDFQGWNLDGARPGTKNDDGSWSITLELPLDGEVSYKFNVDGEWTEDPLAVDVKDDGFGGLNGVVFVADLLAAPGAAPASRGLAPGLFYAAWGDVNLFTQSPSGAVKGVAYDSTTVSQKAYLKTSGYLFKDLLFIATEFRLFDESITLSDYDYSYNATSGKLENTVVTEWTDGLEELNALPWQFFSKFIDGWDSGQVNGKFRGLLELKDINMNVSHSVGWSKSTVQELGNFWIEYYGDPDDDEGKDSSLGVTEVFNQEALDFGFATLNYNVIFNTGGYSDEFRNIIAIDGTAMDIIEYELATVLDSNTNDIAFYFEDLTGTALLGLGITPIEDLSVTLQGGLDYSLVDGASSDAPFFGNLGVAFDFGMSSIYGDVQFYGEDSSVGEVSQKFVGSTAGDSIADKLISEVNFNIDVTSDINVYIENDFEIASFSQTTSSISDTLKAGATVGLESIEIAPELEVVLPLEDGVDFAINYFQVGVNIENIEAELRWEPNTDYTVNSIKLKGLYSLTDVSGVTAGLGFELDDNDNNQIAGAHVGYYAKTGWTAVKDPFWFANLNYNLYPLDGADNYQFKDIDDGAWDVGKGLTARVGIRMDF